MISIGIPTYNQADTLGATIESFINQSVKPLEIVVSENWCTDHTQEVLKDFEGKIKVVRPERHLSMMENWNFLVSQLQGDWFSLMSSDDLALPNFVEDILAGINEHADAVLIRGPHETIDAEGAVISIRGSQFAARKRAFPSNFYEQIRGTKTSFAAFSVKKSSFTSVGGFDESFIYAGDYALWLKLSPLGSFVTLPKRISQYRSDYRPGITTARMRAFIADKARLRLEVIPSIRNDFTTKCMNAATTSKSLRWILNNSDEKENEFKEVIAQLKKIEGNLVERLIGDLLNKLYRIRTMK